MTEDARARRPAEGGRLSDSELALTRHLLMHGPLSRRGLGDVLRLSDASMSRLTRALVEDGMIVQDLDLRPGIGRPRQILSAAPTARHVIGVKLTGDTAYAVACDLAGSVLATGTASLPEPDGDGVVPVHEAVMVVKGLVRRLGRRLPSVDRVGLALGGLVRDHARVVEATFLGWHDIDLAARLADELSIPVTVSNDVAALAREQLWFGAGRTHSTFAVVTVGAGLGFGIVREGVVVEDLIDNGHLLAHSPIDGSGPRCRLGHRGCVAAYLNREDVQARASARLRRRVSFDDLLAGRATGHAVSTEFVDAASRALGHLVATVAGALQTDRIVLAGEDAVALSGSDSGMRAVVAERLRPGPRESQRCALEVTASPLTFTDWARGAAVVAVQGVLGAL